MLNFRVLSDNRARSEIVEPWCQSCPFRSEMPHYRSFSVHYGQTKILSKSWLIYKKIVVNGKFVFCQGRCKLGWLMIIRPAMTDDDLSTAARLIKMLIKGSYTYAL